jgi:hypothetical protein
MKFRITNQFDGHETSARATTMAVAVKRFLDGWTLHDEQGPNGPRTTGHGPAFRLKKGQVAKGRSSFCVMQSGPGLRWSSATC